MVLVLVVYLYGFTVIGKFWVPDLLQHNPGSKIQGSGDGDPKMGVFDGTITATSHLLTR